MPLRTSKIVKQLHIFVMEDVPAIQPIRLAGGMEILIITIVATCLVFQTCAVLVRYHSIAYEACGDIFEWDVILAAGCNIRSIVFQRRRVCWGAEPVKLCTGEGIFVIIVRIVSPMRLAFERCIEGC